MKKTFPKVRKQVEGPLIGLIFVSIETLLILADPFQIPLLLRYILWALLAPLWATLSPTCCLAGSFSSLSTHSLRPSIKEVRRYPIRIRLPTPPPTSTPAVPADSE